VHAAGRLLMRLACGVGLTGNNAPTTALRGPGGHPLRPELLHPETRGPWGPRNVSGTGGSGRGRTTCDFYKIRKTLPSAAMNAAIISWPPLAPLWSALTGQSAPMMASPAADFYSLFYSLRMQIICPLMRPHSTQCLVCCDWAQM
jgi:hypothetical protein